MAKTNTGWINNDNIWDYIEVTVKWKSGYISEPKSGIVRGFIPKKQLPSKIYPNLANISSTCIKLGNGLGSSQNDRVLIEVERFHKRTNKRLPSYWYGVKPADIDYSGILSVEGK